MGKNNIKKIVLMLMYSIFIFHLVYHIVSCLELFKSEMTGSNKLNEYMNE